MLKRYRSATVRHMKAVLPWALRQLRAPPESRAGRPLIRDGLWRELEASRPVTKSVNLSFDCCRRIRATSRPRWGLRWAGRRPSHAEMTDMLSARQITWLRRRLVWKEYITTRPARLSCITSTHAISTTALHEVPPLQTQRLRLRKAARYDTQRPLWRCEKMQQHEHYVPPPHAFRVQV